MADGSSDTLARIVAGKRVDVARRLAGRSFTAEPTRRSLRAALARPGARFVMEVKRASPSGHRSEVGVEAAARAYAPVADAISVLTDGPDFGGSLADIATVRAAFDGPILAKDFIVDPRQVAEARAAGADAVLAMLSVLDDAEARAVLAEAERLGMDAIVEVHDEVELGRALVLGAAIVGINNRDLKSLKTDLAVTERLAGLVPAGVLLISESGIAGRGDVERLAPIADAFLVGSSLMAAPNVAEAARTLVHGRVKVCGLTNAEDVALAAASGATHAGLIFVPGTQRAITVEAAKPLAEQARRLGLRTVGVFRDAAVAEVGRVAGDLGLDAVQLHGSESGADIAALRKLVPQQTEIWGVCTVNGCVTAPRAAADRTLFDLADKSGAPFDWSRIADREDLPKAFLAGALSPANAAAAAKVGAFGLDVCSGIEIGPGAKDPAKVAGFFAALRPASRSNS